MAPLRKKPAEWLEAETGLGQALATRGDRLSDSDLLQEAADTLSEALEKAPPQTTPATLAALRTELAYALLLAGMRETGTESLDKAAALLREALAATSRQDAPQTGRASTIVWPRRCWSAAAATRAWRSCRRRWRQPTKR